MMENVDAWLARLADVRSRRDRGLLGVKSTVCESRSNALTSEAGLGQHETNERFDSIENLGSRFANSRGRMEMAKLICWTDQENAPWAVIRWIKANT